MNENRVNLSNISSGFSRKYSLLTFLIYY